MLRRNNTHDKLNTTTDITNNHLFPRFCATPLQLNPTSTPNAHHTTNHNDNNNNLHTDHHFPPDPAFPRNPGRQPPTTR